MRTEENPEIREVKRYTVNPGETSEVIHRETKEFLVVIAVSGIGSFRSKKDDNGWLIPTNGCTKADFHDGNDFVLEVHKQNKEPLVAIILTMLRTKHLQ